MPVRTLWDNGVLLGAGGSAPIKGTKAMTDNQILIGHTGKPPTPGDVDDLPIINALQQLGRGCRIRNTANLNIPTATQQVLTFNTDDFDDDNIHDPGVNPSRITFAVNGRYLVGGCVQWDATLGNDRQLILGLNGTVVASVYQPAATAIGGLQSLTTVVNVTVGQFVELAAAQNTAGTIQVVAAGVYSPVLWAIRVI
jgi:hypothetical protein